MLGPEIAETDSVDFTVSESSARSLKKGLIIHLCELALPVGAVVSRKFASLMTFLVRYGGLLPPSTDALILICILSTPSKSARGIPFANPEYRNPYPKY